MDLEPELAHRPDPEDRLDPDDELEPERPPRYHRREYLWDPHSRGPLAPGAADHPSYVLIRLGEAVRRLLADALGEPGPPPGWWAALCVLDRAGPLRQVVLAERLRVRSSNLIDLIADMEEDGLIVRERHPFDGRAWSLSISSEGRATVAEARPRIERLDQRVAAYLDDDEYERLPELLRRLVLGARA